MSGGPHADDDVVSGAHARLRDRPGELADRVLASGPPTMLYQPIVDLAFETYPVIGYEALARWPGVTDASAEAVFESARQGGRVRELDRTCSTAAVRGALDAGLDTDTAVFVNVEPIAMKPDLEPHLLPPWRAAVGRLNIVLELTERRLLEHSARLLEGIAAVREQGWLIAVDDVGVNPQSLAMLEFIRPDLVKLDLSFVQGSLDADSARTLRGVAAYVERSGASLVAEGIETEEQLERAIALGATHGQGFLFGRPGVLRPGTRSFRPRRVDRLEQGETPFQIVSSKRGYRIARKAVLDNLSADIERRAAGMTDPPVVLVALRQDSGSPAELASRWAELARHTQMMVIFANGVGGEPDAGIRVADLGDDAAMRGQAAIVVLGTDGAIALAACDLGDSGDESQSRFRYSMTQDRDLVAAAGLTLLNRIRPA